MPSLLVISSIGCALSIGSLHVEILNPFFVIELVVLEGEDGDGNDALEERRVPFVAILDCRSAIVTGESVRYGVDIGTSS